MTEILQDIPINVSPERVFQAISTPAGLDQWWSKNASGTPAKGQIYELSFGPGYEWQAQVTRFVPNAEFELEFVRADLDWTGTRVAFETETRDGKTWIRFNHTGWASPNEHYRISCHCWAMYLRILRRYLEHGEFVPYEIRLDV